MSARGINYGNDERSPPNSDFVAIPFNGYNIFVVSAHYATIKNQLHELLSQAACHVDLEEKLLTAETSLQVAESKVEFLTGANNIQTDRIERLENAVRTLAPYEQFFRAITALLRLPVFTSTPTSTLAPNGDTNV